MPEDQMTSAEVGKFALRASSSIRVAHETSPSCWSLQGSETEIKFNVGNKNLLEFYSNKPWRMTVDKNVVPGYDIDLLDQNTVKSYTFPGYSNFTKIKMDQINRDLLLEKFGLAHEAAIRTVAMTSHQNSFSQSHNDALRISLQKAIGEKIPVPSYYSETDNTNADITKTLYSSHDSQISWVMDSLALERFS